MCIFLQFVLMFLFVYDEQNIFRKSTLTFMLIAKGEGEAVILRSTRNCPFSKTFPQAVMLQVLLNTNNKPLLPLRYVLFIFLP